MDLEDTVASSARLSRPHKTATRYIGMTDHVLLVQSGLVSILEPVGDGR